MSDSNKVKFGLDNVHYAKMHVTTAGTIEYDTPKPWPGAVDLSLDPQGEQVDFYADNVDYFSANSNTGYEGDFESAKVPESFKTDVYGEVADADGVVYEKAEANSVPFALLFQFSGDKNKTRHVLFNCTASRPTLASHTNEEGIEVQTETVTIRAASILSSALNANIVKGSCSETESTAYASWYTTVHQPV